MPAFCYLRHEREAPPPEILRKMGDALRPDDPSAPGNLRQVPAPGGTLLFWAAPHVRMDLHQAPCGGLALLTGEAIGPESPRRLAAEEVFEYPPRFHSASGYFGWLRILPEGNLEAGADPFGLFPLYFFQSGETLAVATSTAALRAHPLYDRTIDQVGMFRHLIENGGVGARTLEQGGKRLLTGHILRFSPAQPHARQLPQMMNWRCSAPKIRDEQEGVDLSIAMSRQAFLRQTEGRLEHMLLSGGLDSRHLAALVRENGGHPQCHTFGSPTDMEAALARRVARGIRAPWRCVPDAFPPAPDLVRSELRAHSLAGGFNTVTLRGVEAVGRGGGRRLLSGLFLDTMYSPMLRSPSPHEIGSFDYCMDLWINRTGVKIETLRALTRPGEPREALEAALDEIHREWEAYPGDLTDRLWMTILQHRMRPHLGGYLWKCCFHSWLMLPALDVPFVLATRRISGDLLKGRELQRQTVARISPALARIPLDSISDSPQSILPGRWNALSQRVYFQQLRRAGLSRADIQRFPKLMSLTHPVWQEIHRLAEFGRPAAETYFDTDALRTVLPPFTRTQAPQPGQLAAHGGHRLLLGLMLWLDGNSTSIV